MDVRQHRSPRSPRVPRLRLGVALLALAPSIALAACSGGDASPASSGVPTTSRPATSDRPRAEFPDESWKTTDPKAAGMDPAKLDEIAARAERAGSTCLAVFRDGKLVEDWYWKGTSATTSQEVWSVTKSVTSTLVGIAQDEGKLDVEDRASAYIPEWRGTPSETVTVRNLLFNDSGRHFDLGADNSTLLAQPDQISYAIGDGQDAPPGTVWAYNNTAIETLAAVLRKATGEEAAAYAQRKLLEPIGMTHSKMSLDPSGNTIMYLGLQSTCHDLARFGHLLLNEGRWNGRQILSAAYIEAATGAASTELNGAYGYLFWINRPGRIAGARNPATAGVDDDRPIRQVAPGAPEDMYWAAGIGGQTVQVDPGTNTVVTRIGPANPPEGVKEFGRGETAKVVTEAVITE